MSDCRVPMTICEKPGHEIAKRDGIVPRAQIERRGPSVDDIPTFRWNGYEFVPVGLDFKPLCNDDFPHLEVEFLLRPKFEEVDNDA